MARVVTFPAVVAVLLLLAGCLGAQDDGFDQTNDPAPEIIPGQDVSPIQGDPLPTDGPDHDHSDPAQHQVAENIELLAQPEVDPAGDPNYWNPAIPIGLDIRFGEMDVKGDWLAQCSRDAGGAYLWDISDRADPVLAGRMTDVGTCADVKLTDDAMFAIVGGNRVYDLSNKSDPIQVIEPSDSDMPGCHMCSITVIDDKEYVVYSAQGSTASEHGFDIALFDRDGPTLVPVGSWRKQFSEDSVSTLAEQDIANTVHDQYVYFDPLLNKTIVVPAMWDYGIYMVDITDPANPTDLGHWGAYRGESGNIHTTAVDIREIDGQERRIIVAATETGAIIGGLSAVEPGYIYIFDATDPADIQVIGKWYNPGQRSTGFGTDFFPVGEYSAHNVQFLQGKVYMAHYHAGVWVIDIDAFLASDPGAKGATRNVMADDIPNLGVHLTWDDEVQRPGAVWDVVVSNGYIYASDYSLGLYVMHYLGDPLNDPAYTSTA